jgi:2Fe-2S ferredoxin
MPDPSSPVQQNQIQITVLYEGDVYELETFAGEYRNLMMLIFDKIFTEDFGECKGMGRCGTCMVEILSDHPALGSLERNEESTIGKITTARKNIRLSCQLLVNSSLQGIKVKILREGQ